MQELLLAIRGQDGPRDVRALPHADSTKGPPDPLSRQQLSYLGQRVLYEQLVGH